MKRTKLIAAAAFLLAGLAPAAAASAKRIPAPFTGVTVASVNGGTDNQLGMLARAGVSSVRFSLDWAHIQSSPAEENWSAADSLIGAIASRGMHPLPVLYSAPAWAVGRTILGIPVDNPPPETAPVMLPQAPQAESAWHAWVRDAVRRYGPGGSFWSGAYQSLYPGARPQPVHIWQVWNEPNLDLFFKPAPSPVRYAALVRISYDAIKSVDPGAIVALAGMPGEVKLPGYRFLARLYRVPGFGSDFNLVAAHAYGINLKVIRRQLNRYRAVMRHHGDRSMKLWVSEYSWGSASGGSRLNRGRAGQAHLLSRTLRMLVAGRRRWKLSGASWYDLQDPPRPLGQGCGWCSFAGLFDVRGRAKPSWRSFRALVHG